MNKILNLIALGAFVASVFMIAEDRIFAGALGFVFATLLVSSKNYVQMKKVEVSKKVKYIGGFVLLIAALLFFIAGKQGYLANDFATGAGFICLLCSNAINLLDK